MHAIGVSEVISVPDRIPVIFALRRCELQSFYGTELLKATASSSTRVRFFSAQHMCLYRSGEFASCEK